MEHSSSVLALAGALLLAGGSDSRLERVTSGGLFTERSAAAAWSRPLQNSERAASKELAAHGGQAEGRGARHLALGSEAGQFSLLTYNVAGLPELVSGSDPHVNMALISPLLNHYDVALVQEDFSYHTQLTSRAGHAYRSEPMQHSLALVHDGLNWFSRFAFGWVHRVRWQECNGFLGAASDCLADKGFSFAEMTLSERVRVDVYNLHAEAGGAPLDVDVRRKNFEQLADYIRMRSPKRPVIVAGDTNLRVSVAADATTLQRFLDSTGLSDTCRRFACGEERIDRVFYRGSEDVELDVVGWWTDRRFVDVRGEPLSDHPAIGVEISWRRSVPRELLAGR